MKKRVINVIGVTGIYEIVRNIAEIIIEVFCNLRSRPTVESSTLSFTLIRVGEYFDLVLVKSEFITSQILGGFDLF